MRAPNLHSVAVSLWAREFDRRPLVERGERGAFLDRLVPELQRADGENGWRWGRKSRVSNTGPLSDDTLGYWLGPHPAPSEPMNGQLDAVDVISSGGEVIWLDEPEHDYRNIFAMWWPVAGAAEPGDGEPGDGEPGDGEPGDGEPDDDDDDDPLQPFVVLLEGLVGSIESLAIVLAKTNAELKALREQGIDLRAKL